MSANVKTAEKDTYVPDPTRPGVEVFVRAGDPLPVYDEDQFGNPRLAASDTKAVLTSENKAAAKPAGK